MKKFTLCSMLACFSCFLAAQSVKLDSTFGVNGVVETDLQDANLNPYGYNMVGLPDGKVVIVGGMGASFAIEKFEHNGTIDTNFTTLPANLSEYHFGVFIQQDGKIIASAHESSPPYNVSVARLNIDGGMDSTFGTAGVASIFVDQVYISNLFQVSDGKIVVHGCESLNNGNPPVIVTRLNSNGSIDSSFGDNGHFRLDIVNDYEFLMTGLEQPDGKLLFAGMANWNLLLLRLNPDGTRDSTFSTDGILVDPMPTGGEAYCLKLQPDGKIVVGGYSDPAYKPIIARYHPNGTRDNTFGNAGVHYFSNLPQYQEGVGIEILPNGKMIMVISDLDERFLHLAQLLPNGQIDSSFGINGVFKYTQNEIRPRSIVIHGNSITVSARNRDDLYKIILLRFLLDLNVGTLNPNAPADPSPWIYPNPIAEQFTLEFGLTQKEQLSIHLFDMEGRLIQTFAQNESFERGEHNLSLSCPSHLAAGNYVLSLEVAGKKMTSVQIMKK